MTEAKFNIPKTVDEAVEILIQNTNMRDKIIIADMQEEDLFLLHHGFGTCIRNNFKMWEAGSELVKNCAIVDESIKGESQYVHPDDASHVIVKALWKKLNERTLC